MAAQKYYNKTGGSSNMSGRDQSPGFEGSSALNEQQSARSTPPYISQPPYLAAANHRSPPSVSTLSASPFDTPFDDYIYPTKSHHTPPLSQHTSQEDMSYRSLARDSTEDVTHNHSADDIPLQTQGPVSGKDAEMQDHVYEASQQPHKQRNSGVDFGELGMFGARNSKRIPWAVYTLTLAQVGVFVGEIAKNTLLTGSPIMIKPQFNPMIGPSSFVLINMGSRFVACMHEMNGITNNTQIGWPCPNSTTLDANSPEQQCTLAELCGFGMQPYTEPNQWFRFIVPMFLHAGLIHIGFNLLLQMTLGKDMEKAIGTIRFTLVYISSGIFGFVMGANFAATGISSTGASGSLFGMIALNLLDLLYSWKERRNPAKDFLFIVMEIVISFVLGLLPGLDNFSHIGGFLMGLVLGICILHSPNSLRRRIGENVPYASVSKGYQNRGVSSFLKNPVGFFRGRKPLWWAWWLIRAGALVLVSVVFIILLNNFYVYRSTCSWCKYLSCLPVNNWCETGNLMLTSETSKHKRALGVLEASRKMAMISFD